MPFPAISTLAQLSDDRLFATVAEGLSLVSRNVHRLAGDARVLWDAQRPQGYQALTSFATEEAAKALILLDAVRCPRRPAETFSRHLSSFRTHLAKGIYGKIYAGRPATFREVADRVRSLRREFFLDGPEGVDWIFRDTISAERERWLYVDYVDLDETRAWVGPPDDAGWMGPPGESPEPAVVSVVRALGEIGCFTAAALAVIAEQWRAVDMTDGFDWADALRGMNERTLRSMQERRVLGPVSGENFRRIVDHWLFPLYSIEMTKLLPVAKATLRAAQDEWLYRELGITYED